MTWDDPMMVGDPPPWGPWDWAWVGFIVFGAGCLVGSIITMLLT